MPTNFPSALDTFPSAAVLAANTLNTDPHSALHGNLGDALAALEAKVGIDGSSVPSSLDYLLGLKAALASPTFTGSPSGPTPSLADSSTRFATTAYVHGQGYLTSVPPAPVSSVFGRVGAVLPVSGDYSVGQVTGAAPLASPAFTGVPTVPTATLGTNTTQAASTAFVLANAPALPADVVQADVANTFTVGPQTIQTGADGNKGLLVKGNSATQSDNLQEWQDSSGTAMAYVSGYGTVKGSANSADTAGILAYGSGSISQKFLSCHRGSDGYEFLNFSVVYGTGVVITENGSGTLVLRSNEIRLQDNSGNNYWTSTPATGWTDAVFTAYNYFGYLNTSTSLWLSLPAGVAYARAALRTAFFQIHNVSPASLIVPTAMLEVLNDDSGKTGLLVQGASSQSAPLVQLRGQSSIQAREQADLDTAWVDSTDATRKARVLFRAWDTAAREGLRIEADGTNPRIGFLGASAVSRPAVTGSRGGNAALASLLSALASLGLITDSTTA